MRSLDLIESFAPGAQARRSWLCVAALGAIAGCATAPPASSGEAPRATTASPLAGTWVLVAADDLQPDGRRTHAYGEAPRGTLMVDATGRYSLQIYRGDRPVFAAGTKAKGTPAEFEAAAMGMSAHLGRCEINAATHTLDFHIESAAFPNWEGTTQKREFTLAGDELSYLVPLSASKTAAQPISVWRRVRPGG